MGLMILALVWAVFLVPQVLRARAEGSPADSIGAFRKQLYVLSRTSPGRDGEWAGPEPRPVSTYAFDRYSPRRSIVRKRRRQILVGLLAAMSATLVLGLIPGFQVVLLLHLVLDVLCAAYVGLLIRARNLAEERDLKVRFFPSTPAGAESELLLTRSAN